MLNFYPYGARILEALVRVARDEQPLFQGYAHSIASLLRPEVFAARPGVSLSEARRNTLDMLRELKILDRNILDAVQWALVADQQQARFNKAANEQSRRGLYSYVRYKLGSEDEVGAGPLRARRVRVVRHPAIADDRDPAGDFACGIAMEATETDTHVARAHSCCRGARLGIRGKLVLHPRRRRARGRLAANKDPGRRTMANRAGFGGDRAAAPGPSGSRSRSGCRLGGVRCYFLPRFAERRFLSIDDL